MKKLIGRSGASETEDDHDASVKLAFEQILQAPIPFANEAEEAASKVGKANEPPCV